MPVRNGSREEHPMTTRMLAFASAIALALSVTTTAHAGSSSVQSIGDSGRGGRITTAPAPSRVHSATTPRTQYEPTWIAPDAERMLNMGGYYPQMIFNPWQQPPLPVHNGNTGQFGGYGGAIDNGTTLPDTFGGATQSITDRSAKSLPSNLVPDDSRSQLPAHFR
jgi:hypothetical protein